MDWKQVITELVGLGYTQARIAQECNCGQMTVSDLLTGKTADPRLSTAQAILGLRDRARRQAKRQQRERCKHTQIPCN